MDSPPSIRFPLILFLLATHGAQAQPVSFGVKGGVPLTDAVAGSFGGSSEARPYTVGFMPPLPSRQILCTRGPATARPRAIPASQSRARCARTRGNFRC